MYVPTPNEAASLKLTETANTSNVNMSGTDETYNLTKEDIRKTESQASKAHGGNVPADSDAAGLQVRSNETTQPL